MTTKTTHLLIGLLITTALAGGIFAGTVVRDRNVAGASAAQGDPTDHDNGSNGQARNGGAGSADDFTPPEARPCTDAEGGCAIDLGDNVNISVGDDADIVVREDGGFDVTGDVTVPTAAGPVDLIDADLEIGMDENGEPTIIGGTAQVPFPTTGILADAVINHLPEGLVGIDYGRNLRNLGAHLQDDRQYVYFHFDGGIDIGLPFGGTEGYEAVPSEISVPTGVSATLVLDPSDPYFYVGGPCPSFEDQDDDSSDDDRDNDDSESGRGRQDDDDDNTSDNNEGSDDNPTDGSDDDERKDDPNDEPETEDSDALIELEPEGAAPGEDCGIGFSLQGNIPAPTVEGTDPFFGHIVVDGIIPLYAAMELDGTVVLEVRDDKVRTAGTGDLSATLPLIDGLVDIQIPLGSAGVDIEAGGTRISVGFEGKVGGQDPTYVLPLIDVPVTLPSDGSIELTALLSFTRGADGVVRIDPESHAEIIGELSLGFGGLGDPLGVDLDSLVTSDAFLRIDPAGFTVQGSTTTNLHPSLATQGRLALDGRVSFPEPADSYVRLDGEVTVAGITLGEAAIDLSRAGLFVEGRVEGIFSEVALAGSIGPDGINLAGSSSIEFPLDVLERLAQGAIGGIDAAQAEVDKLQGEIDALRVQIRQERRDRSQDFQAASRALDAAQAEVDVLQRNIDINNGKIADLRRDQAAEIRRFENLTLIEQGIQSIPHLATLALIEGEIGVLTTANVTQAGLHFAATGVLDGAQLLLDGIEAGLDAIPVDTDPRIIVLFAAKETATFALQTARTVADAVSIGGTLRGEITWELGTSGLAASLIAEYCDDGCTTLAGGSVRLTPTPEACVEVIGIAEACVAI